MPKQNNKISKHPGLGAVVHDESATFRVWAPHAEKVYVTGTFNDWQENATPLHSEESGYWSGDVPRARAGDEYR